MNEDWRAELIHCAKILAIACIIVAVFGALCGCKTHKSVSVETDTNSTEVIRQDSIKVEGIFNLSWFQESESADSAIITLVADSIITPNATVIRPVIKAEKHRPQKVSVSLQCIDSATIMRFIRLDSIESQTKSQSDSIAESASIAEPSGISRWIGISIGIAIALIAIYFGKRLI